MACGLYESFKFKNLSPINFSVQKYIADVINKVDMLAAVFGLIKLYPDARVK